MAKRTKVQIPPITQRQAGTLSCALAECERLNLIRKRDVPMVQRLHNTIKRSLEQALNE